MQRATSLMGISLSLLAVHAGGAPSSWQCGRTSSAVVLGDQQQRLHRGLSFVGVLVCLRDELATARQGNRIVERSLPAFEEV